MSFTLIIIVFTALSSLSAFNNQRISDQMILWPRRMKDNGEYYRLLTSGFIHADWMHLIFNMLALYFFGRFVESAFEYVGIPAGYFMILYFVGIVVASLPSLIKHKDNPSYRSLGASGGVSAVLFSFVYFAPWETILIWFIPVPGIVAAVGYVIYSAYMAKKGGGYVNHDAHLWGAIFGFLFTLAFAPDHGANFLRQLMNPYFHF